MKVLIGRVRYFISILNILSGIKEWVLFNKSTADFRIFLRHSLVKAVHSWFISHMLIRCAFHWQYLHTCGIVSVEKPEVCVIPNDFISIVEVSSIVFRPIFHHLLVSPVLI